MTTDLPDVPSTVPTRKRWRPLGWAFLGVAGVVLGALALKALFPPETLRRVALPLVERRVGRQVEIGAVSLKVFPRIAIRLADVKIPDPPGFGSEPAIAADALDLELRFWPLLRKEFVLSRVTVRGLAIRYVVGGDGRSNIAGLASSDSATSGRSSGRPAALQVNDFRVLGGTVQYVNADSSLAARLGIEADGSLGQAPQGAGLVSTGELSLSGIAVRMASLGADTIAVPDARLRYRVVTDPAGDSVAAPVLSLVIGAVRLDGSAAIRQMDGPRIVDLGFTSDTVDIAGLIAGLPPARRPAGMDISGRAVVTVRASGAMTDGPLAVNGLVHLEEVAVDHAASGAEVRNMTGDVAIDRETIVSSSLGGMLWGRPLTLAFRVDSFADPRLAAHATGSVALARLQTADTAPATGDAAFDLTVTGPLKEVERLQVTGPIDLTNVDYRPASLAAPAHIERARLELTGTGATASNIPVKVGGSDATVSFRSPTLVSYALARDSIDVLPPITFSLTSTRLDLGELLPDTLGYGQLMTARLAGKRVQGQEPGDIARQRYRVPSQPRARIEGRVRLAEVVKSKTIGRDLAFDVALAQGILEVRDLKGTLYGGAVTGRLTLDLRPRAPPYPASYAIQFRGAQSADLLQRWTRLGRAVAGTVDFDIDGVASLDEGLLPLTEALRASGSAAVIDGRFEEFRPAQALFERLQVETPAQRTFKQLGGLFRIERGAFVVDDWRYTGSQVAGTIGGSAGLDGGLDLRLSLGVPPELLQRAGLLQGGSALTALTQQLAGANDTLKLAVGIGGTVSSPALVIDTDAFRREVERRLASQGRGVIDRLIRPRSGQPTQP